MKGALAVLEKNTHLESAVIVVMMLEGQTGGGMEQGNGKVTPGYE